MNSSIERVEHICTQCRTKYNEQSDLRSFEWLFPTINNQKSTICKYCILWNAIILHYRHAFSEDEYMNNALDNIERVLFEIRVEDKIPTPSRFKQLLDDRLIEIDKKVVAVWNIAVDECSLLAAVPRWESTSFANYKSRASSFIKNIW